MPTPAIVTGPQPPGVRQRPSLNLGGGERLRIVPWLDPVADPHGVHPCSRYVELYWLPVIGPSTTWLIRRLSYGLEMHPSGLNIGLVETARSLGLGERMGKTLPSVGPSSGSAPSSWPGPTGRTPLPCAPASRRSPSGT